MVTDFYLIANDRMQVKVTKKPPSLLLDEVAIRCHLEIPDKLFQQPLLHASIRVEGFDPHTIDPQIVVDTVDMIEKATGVKIQFTILPPERKEGE